MFPVAVVTQPVEPSTVVTLTVVTQPVEPAGCVTLTVVTQPVEPAGCVTLTVVAFAVYAVAVASPFIELSTVDAGAVVTGGVVVRDVAGLVAGVAGFFAGCGSVGIPVVFKVVSGKRGEPLGVRQTPASSIGRCDRVQCRR